MLPTRRNPADAASQLLYILSTGWTVVPFARQGKGWICAVIGGTQRAVFIRDELIETAATATVADPTANRDVFLDSWSARMWPRWPGQNSYAFFATRVRDSLLPPDEMTIRLTDPEVWRTVAIACRVPLDGLGKMLNNLVAAGMLEPVGDRAYKLTLPAPSAMTDPVRV